MLKATLLVPALLFALAPSAKAEGAGQPIQMTLQQTTTATTSGGDVVEVQTHPNPAGTIIGDAVGGAVLGGAIGGGVAACRRYCNSNGTWGNWQRDVLIGAGIGLGVGLIVGGVSAASQADRTWAAPMTEQRDIGFSAPLGAYGTNF